VQALPRLCQLYPVTCLTTEGKGRKNLSQGKKPHSEFNQNWIVQLRLILFPLSNCNKTSFSDFVQVTCAETGVAKLGAFFSGPFFFRKHRKVIWSFVTVTSCIISKPGKERRNCLEAYKRLRCDFFLRQYSF